ncbi:alpha-2-macroglobulin [Prochlorococcus sp. MIT 1341]|uniref:alpha-2-macroglobulin n=1 Tax=Prochlorococcus sp. MIT 1341 TaxID=3096221 RepID=UPI002A74854B|nr:alpha-2-macroglobulin [Prochlorococcus sp. MIT 1341]
MNYLKKPLYTFLALSSLLSSCTLLNKYESFFDFDNVETKVTQQEIVYIYCDEGDIQEYVDDGWKIIDSETEEVPCSWKVERSRPGCKLEDKGCKISVPDKIGKQVKYILEKETIVPKEKEDGNQEIQ